MVNILFTDFLLIYCMLDLWIPRYDSTEDSTRSALNLISSKELEFLEEARMLAKSEKPAFKT